MCKKSVEKAIKYIAKNAEREKTKFNAVFEHDEMIYASDGFQVLRTLEDVDNSLVKECSEGIDKLMNAIFDNEGIFDYQPYDCPDVSELENKIKNLKSQCKSKTRPLWQVRIGYAIANDILVNAEYLLNAIKSTGATRLFSGGRTKPMIFFGEDTQYVLLPVGNDGDLTAGEIKILH